METLTDLSWRAYPASMVMAAGVALFAYGMATLRRAFGLSIWSSERPIVHMSGFRAAIIGLSIAGIGAAWLSQQLWVLLIALAIGGGELLETSFILFVLRHSSSVSNAVSEHAV